MYTTQAYYIGKEFPEDYGKKIIVKDDNSQPNNPCYKIKFEGKNTWYGNMADEDFQLNNPLDSIVKINLLNQVEYMPYCGSNIPRPPIGNGCNNPRTIFDGDQFFCKSCGWRSSFEKNFINAYKSKWNK